MNRNSFSRSAVTVLFIALLVALTSSFSAHAQGSSLNLRVSNVSKKSVKLRWDSVEPNAFYVILFRRVSSDSFEFANAGNTFGNSFTVSGLLRGAAYEFQVQAGDYTDTVRARTLRSTSDEGRHTPPPETCAQLPDLVVVTGYVENTHCQIVDDVAISGHTDLQARGFVNAVDVWNYVNGGLEVCFTYHGWIVFLDAAYAPRMAMELEHTHRNGLTCGTIDRAGTVVMLDKGPSPSQPQTQLPAEAVAKPDVEPLPAFEAIPLADCQIKLMETLYLRAAPAGEIIGLVWLNSEVPAFEIYGYWYKIEFEGATGYISRYHREVLRGGCG